MPCFSGEYKPAWGPVANLGGRLFTELRRDLRILFVANLEPEDIREALHYAAEALREQIRNF